MTCFTWTLPTAATSAAPSVQANTSLVAAMRQLFGVDIWLNVADARNPDRIVTAARDWRLVDGDEAVRQSLLRRLVTAPGEWKTKPDYGVGARAYVKMPATKNTVDALANRIVAQYHRDKRVEEVSAVTVDWDSSGLFIVAVSTKLRGRSLTNKPFVVSASLR